jgi:hypothetical protein
VVGAERHCDLGISCQARLSQLLQTVAGLQFEMGRLRADDVVCGGATEYDEEEAGWAAHGHGTPTVPTACQSEVLVSVRVAK